MSPVGRSDLLFEERTGLPYRLEGIQKTLAHDFKWGGTVEPVFEREGSLVQKEGESVGGFGSGAQGVGDQRCGGAISAIDHVEHEVMRAEGTGWDQACVIRLHAEGGGVDDEVDVLQLGVEMLIIPGNGGDVLDGAEHGHLGAQFTGKEIGLFGGAIGKHEAPTAFEGALDSDSASGTAAGTEDEYSEITQVSLKGFFDASKKPGAVGVVTVQLTVAQGEGVDGSEASSSGVEVIDRVEGFEFVGNGDVDAEEPGVGEFGEGFFDLTGRDLDADVRGGDAGSGERWVMHLR